MKKIKILIINIFIFTFLYSSEFILPKFEKSPIIDGIIDEEWENSLIFKDFREFQPKEGGIPEAQTEVYMAYEQNSIYFAFKCYDDVKTIRKTLTKRDNFAKEEGYILVSGNKRKNKYENKSRTIEYNDEETIICVILKQNGKWVNDYLNESKAKVVINDKKIIIHKSENIKNIKWEVMIPKLQYEKRGNCDPTYKCEVEKYGEYSCSKDVYWINLEGKDYEIIGFENESANTECVKDQGNQLCWGIKPKKEIGTYWYRAIIEMEDGKKNYRRTKIFK